MARTSLLCLTVAISLIAGCSEPLTPDQKSQLISEVEARLVMPDGAADLRCYRRQYALMDGEGSDEGKTALVGAFTREKGVAPGIVWEKSVKDLPGIVDQGCGNLTVRYVLGDHPRPLHVACYPTLDGGPPPPEQAALYFKMIDQAADACAVRRK